MISLKRAYDPPSADDGERYLVERLWPRGLTRDAARLTGWLKELAPSPELRQWFSHDPARWDEFRRRYQAELGRPAARTMLRELAERARRGTVTLVYAARGTEHNSAVALRDLLQRQPPPG